MRFPLLIDEKMNYPSKPKCAWCKRDKICEPHSMAMLSCGALLMNRKTGDGGSDPRLDGFLDLTWHGAHTSEGGQGKHPDIYARVDIAGRVRGGQFGINFCSTKCLRSFLNCAVDTLERKMKIKKRR